MSETVKLANPTDVAIYRILKEYGEIPRERLAGLVHSLLEDSDNWTVGKRSVQNRISKLEEKGIIESEKVSGYALKSLNDKKWTLA